MHFVNAHPFRRKNRASKRRLKLFAAPYISAKVKIYGASIDWIFSSHFGGMQARVSGSPKF